MSVVCRMKVQEVTARAYGPAKVTLAPQYSSDSAESPEVLAEIRSFFEATPSGSLELNINNDKAAEQFQPGGDFYLHLEPIPQGS
jgi:hypothetical protein